MEKKKRSAVVLTIALLAGCCFGSKLVNAATYHDFYGAVYAVTDAESANKKKENTESAFFNYTYSTKPSIKLVSWIENIYGENKSRKASYSSYGSKTMDYKKASERVGYKHHLNVSTQAGVVDTAFLRGTWTPN